MSVPSSVDFPFFLSAQKLETGLYSVDQKKEPSTTEEFLPNEIKPPNKWVVCGRNQSFNLGLGHNQPLTSWAEFAPPMLFLQISCGEYHSVALASDGSLWSWGYNNSDQLGFGEGFSGTSSNKPQKIPFFSECQDPVINIHAGGEHTGAITSLKPICSHSI